MKKLIAVFVVFALVAGAVFAQPSVGGQLKAGATLLRGTSADGDVLAGGRHSGQGTQGYVNVSAGDADMGAKVRVFSQSNGDYHSPSAFAFAWWKPTDTVRIQFGVNPDGDWGTAQITGWGFNAEAQDFVALDNDTSDWRNWHGFSHYDQEADHMLIARSAGFYGGIKGDSALLFGLTPADGLGINLGIPFNPMGSQDPDYGLAGDKWMQLHFQVNYTIEDIGKIFFTYQGRGMNKYKDGDNDKYAYSGSDMFLSFYLMAVDGLGVDIGAHIPIVGKTGDIDNPKEQIDIGLGVTYSADDFGVKLRFGAALGGEDKSPITMGFTLLPYYRAEALTIFFQAGLGMVIPDEGDSVVGWFINPYIRVPAGGASVYAGFQLYSNGVEAFPKDGKPDKAITWGVPIGINFYF